MQSRTTLLFCETMDKHIYICVAMRVRVKTNINIFYKFADIIDDEILANVYAELR